MLSKNKIKLFNSLKLRKYRKKHRLFLAEGEKIVCDLLKSDFKCKFLISEHDFTLKDFKTIQYELFKTEYSEMKKISALKTPPPVIGIFETKYDQIPIHDIEITNESDLIKNHNLVKGPAR